MNNYANKQNHIWVPYFEGTLHQKKRKAPQRKANSPKDSHELLGT